MTHHVSSGISISRPIPSLKSVTSSARPLWALSLGCPFESSFSTASPLVMSYSCRVRLFPLCKISVVSHCLSPWFQFKVSVFAKRLYWEASQHIKFSMSNESCPQKPVSLPDSVCFSTNTILSELNLVIFSFFHFFPYLANSLPFYYHSISWSHRLYRW